MPPKPPGADAWVDGEWILRRGRWYWLLGRWVKTPVGATYSPWVVVRGSDGTEWYAESTWRDEKGEPIAPPPALAMATASSEAVVDTQGEPIETGRSLTTAPPARHRASREAAPPAQP